MDHVGGLAAHIRRLNTVPSAAIHRVIVDPMDGAADVSRGDVSACSQGRDGGRYEHPGGLPGVRSAPGHRAQEGGLLRATGVTEASPGPPNWTKSRTFVLQFELVI